MKRSSLYHGATDIFDCYKVDCPGLLDLVQNVTYDKV